MNALLFPQIAARPYKRNISTCSIAPSKRARMLPGLDQSRCLMWVKSAVLTAGLSLPVYPEQRTFSESVGMSQRCQQETHALQKQRRGPLPPARKADVAFDPNCRRD